MSDSQQSRLCHLVLECSNAKGGIKMTPVSLEVTGPSVLMKRRIIPLGLRDPVEKALGEMVSKVVLTPVNSSSWATPIVTLLKRDGKTPRICEDYRVTVNRYLKQSSYAIVEPEDILHQLHGSKFFSSLDFKDAFLQIPLDEKSRELTTINTPFGLFR
ncbi:unnamed protein product [Echinostoma caproni]|uniref:Reverse transcriptase domain-containing protein n=1 Tax=Echinostoma caproni TaxID=27848 RepID=A0A183A3C4_9TREM|nr:unnamed protein product [Echinostoma caproni]